MNQLINLADMGEMTLNQLLNQMTEIDTSSIQYIFQKGDVPVAAVCVFKGEDTASYMNAIKNHAEKLDAESAVAQ